MRLLFLTAFCATITCSSSALARTICTLVSEAGTGKILLEEGSCSSRVTPASTFKIPLALMGFENKILKDSHSPVFSFKAGDPDWGGDAWRQDATPARWMIHSVVWYSQRITHALGANNLHRYAKTFNYGNADFSGDPDKSNGLERAWIASSLKISPHEQVEFLNKLVTYALPVSRHAIDSTINIVANTESGNWQIWGKTGTAYPRRPDQSFDYDHGWGWYVGWAKNKVRTLVFAHLIETEAQSSTPPGYTARNAFLAVWPNLPGL